MSELAAADVITQSVLALARRNEPEYAIENARRVAEKLVTAALEAGCSSDRVAAQLSAVFSDHRVKSAVNPVALLIRGVVGDRRINAPPDRFLLSRPNVMPIGVHAPGFDRGELGRLAPGLQELVMDRVLSREPIGGAWLGERGIALHAVTEARNAVNAAEQREPTDSPLCEALKDKDPKKYRARLESILEDVSVPTFTGVPRTLDHPMILGLCRSRLESQLRDAVGTENA